jgi:hypothetical protein
MKCVCEKREHVNGNYRKEVKVSERRRREALRMIWPSRSQVRPKRQFNADCVSLCVPIWDNKLGQMFCVLTRESAHACRIAVAPARSYAVVRGAGRPEAHGTACVRQAHTRKRAADPARLRRVAAAPRSPCSRPPPGLRSCPPPANGPLPAAFSCGGWREVAILVRRVLARSCYSRARRVAGGEKLRFSRVTGGEKLRFSRGGCMMCT